ncbi:hypothetical protein RJT34_16320 [Clitoria ternatea]|uniref:VQ domain-containing protein n=1 Tax=Clitoria ternatea TaxID=43366 RepID=A0AAN9JA02_CLITE
MNFQDIINPTPKRELQGPRPTPLRINKDSHKIKKPPLPPPPQPQAPPRQPVIIYSVSPKIIHTTPSDFMSLVQRLTGFSSSTSSTDPLNGNNGPAHVSPASRFATIDKAKTPQAMKQHQIGNNSDGVAVAMGHEVERPNMYHGILSPVTQSLSPIPSNFLSSPSMNPNMVSFFQDLSPGFHSNRNFMEGSFMIMPSASSFISPHPTSVDLFNNFSD